MKVIVWADGTWCFDEELEEMTHLSDDYMSIELPDNSTLDEVCYAAERAQAWPTTPTTNYRYERTLVKEVDRMKLEIDNSIYR